MTAGLAAALMISALGLAATSDSASAGPTVMPAPVPQGFIGVDADGPLFDPAANLNLGNQLTSMVADGVQNVRTALDRGPPPTPPFLDHPPPGRAGPGPYHSPREGEGDLNEIAQPGRATLAILSLPLPWPYPFSSP